ncbi:MAG: hypothetical protein KC561_10990, partial [Myxococcales bacterium]|nr:hypothetical protein [Myxococcales bacterium]
TDTDDDGYGDPGYPANTCDPDVCLAGDDDLDADDDNTPDACDTCTDTDNDDFGNPGFPANLCGNDNCPGISNGDQTDADNDGLGDVCDTCTDTDGDDYGDPGYPANTCPLDVCALGDDDEDADDDSTPDACDTCTDTDGDLFGDPGFPANLCADDNCPSTANSSQEDSDFDGIGDACDECTDPDEDGYGNPHYTSTLHTFDEDNEGTGYTYFLGDTYSPPADGLWRATGGHDDGYVYGNTYVPAGTSQTHYNTTERFYAFSDNSPSSELLNGLIEGDFRTVGTVAPWNSTPAQARASWFITNGHGTQSTADDDIWVAKRSFAWNPNDDTDWTRHSVEVRYENFVQWSPFVSTGYVGSEADFIDTVDNATTVGLWYTNANLNVDTHLHSSWYPPYVNYGLIAVTEGAEIGWDNLAQYPLGCGLDNCPDTPNPGQEDADGDFVGDACDACTDTDGDGFGNPDFENWDRSHGLHTFDADREGAMFDWFRGTTAHILETPLLWSSSGGHLDGYVYEQTVVPTTYGETRRFYAQIDTEPRYQGDNLLGGVLRAEFRTVGTVAPWNDSPENARAHWLISDGSNGPLRTWVSRDELSWNPNGDEDWTVHQIEVSFDNFVQWTPFETTGYVGTEQDFNSVVENVTAVGVWYTSVGLQVNTHLHASWYSPYEDYALVAVGEAGEIGWDNVAQYPLGCGWDNCPDDANPDQADQNGNGIGDICE